MKRNPEEILKHYWGHDGFRPGQREIVQHALDGTDTLALLPTGGGKSICFQVPALCMDGVCLVISPLIALMKDQVANLNKRGIKATAVHSGMRYSEVDKAIDSCVHGDVKFLYMSPERLRTDIVKVRLGLMKVCLIAIDEAHCISQWGYDFRPPYLQIAEIRILLHKVPVLALTATATPKVIEDIQLRLGFKNKNVLRQSFHRPNLAYMVLHDEDLKGRLLRIYERRPGCSVIYVRNRRQTEEVASFLVNSGHSATFYHAGLSGDERDLRQHDWISGKSTVMVATNAFGMGIDKPNVRTVLHLGFPDSLEAYFQEAGRAGRDGHKSYAVALIQSKDIEDLRRRMVNIFPSRDFIKNVYNALASCFHIANGSGQEEWFELDMAEFCKKYGWKSAEVLQSISFLEKADHLLLSTHNDTRSTLQFTIPHEQLHDLEVRNPNAARVTKVLMRSYSRLFDGPVPISEKTIANRAGFDMKITLEILHRLNKARVIDYRPSRGLPRINFVNGRVPKDHLYITHEMYEKRRLIIVQTISAALHYTESQLICRSQLLLRYFGEYEAKTCGQCDVCLEAKGTSLRQDQFDHIRARLLNIMSSPISVQDASCQITDVPFKHVVRAMQLMIDNGSIAYLPDGLLQSKTSDKQ